MDQSDLVFSAQSGNLNSFNKLVLANQDKLFRVATNLLNSEDSAADAVQNAFILAYRNIHQFHGFSFSSWLMRILKNVCYDELRSIKRHRTLSLERVDEDDEEYENSKWLADYSMDPSRTIESRDTLRILKVGLKKLPYKYRLIVVLVDIEGLDYAEVAGIVGVPLGTVKSRLARARMRLRGEFSQAQLYLPSAGVSADRFLKQKSIY